MTKTPVIKDTENPFRSPGTVTDSPLVPGNVEGQEPTSFVIRAVAFVIALLSLLYFAAFLGAAAWALLGQNVAFGLTGLVTCGLSVIAAVAAVVLLVSTVRDQRRRGFLATAVWLFAVAGMAAAQYLC
ncbi:MAG: hypothetical protein P8J37_01160 [Fuerstiella sp.]|nr:hypothetical protein [Fuerstiella sp.]